MENQGDIRKVPSSIRISVPHSTIAEDAAILSAYNTFIAAVKSATGKHVDAGGSMIADKPAPAADEGNPHGHAGVW
jgi:hypothetical protein